MREQNVVFMNNELNLRLAGILRLPDDFNLSENYPAVAITGPMMSLKEQAQTTYAKALTKAGYVTLVWDGAYFGESEGTPRQLELPDVKKSDIEGAVDYLESLPYVDNNRIGGVGICGGGSYMSVAGVKEPIVTGENAWSKPFSEEVYEAVPGNKKIISENLRSPISQRICQYKYLRGND